MKLTLLLFACIVAAMIQVGHAEKMDSQTKETVKDQAVGVLSELVMCVCTAEMPSALGRAPIPPQTVS